MKQKMKNKLFPSLTLNALGCLVFLLFSLNTPVLAQKKALTDAILYYEDQDFENARKEIDKAVYTIPTNTMAKTWYYRGMIYSVLHEKTPNPSYLDSAAVSFNQSKKLAEAGSEFATMSTERLVLLWNNSLNEGVKFYQSAEYDKAITFFEISHKANLTDTTALLYGSYAALAKKNYNKACEFCTALKNINYTKSYVFGTCAKAYEVNKNYAAAEKELLEGIKYNKNDINTLQELSNFYISQNENEKALVTLENLNKLNPNNVQILSVLAVQYQKINAYPQAENAYLSILKLEANNYLANFNLGGLYVDQSRSDLNTLNKMSAVQQKSATELKAKIRSNYEKALRYLKQAQVIEPTKNAELPAYIQEIETLLNNLK